MREMCKVFRRLSLHTSTNPKARTTIAPRRVSHELLHGRFLLEVFQVKGWKGRTYREVFDLLFDFMNEHASDKLSAWIYEFEQLEEK